MSREELQEKFERIASYLNEKSERLRCADEAMSLGRGGVTLVSAATGVSGTTITEGMKEIKGEKEVRQDGIRRKGGGRKKKTDEDKTIVHDIENLIGPVTLGDPESSLRWVSKSTRNPAAELRRKGHEISRSSVAAILKDADYSLQADKKTGEGGEDHPDRNAQFYYINTKTKKFRNQKQPVISVDTEKKENVGNYRNNGREYCKKRNPTAVNVYDSIGVPGKASPYGIYDITHDKGRVNAGISHDTAESAVNSIRKRRYETGQVLYPTARKIYITADCGGSNGYRVRLRKTELQKPADEIGIEIHVSHFPPGTGKRNKIGHRMFGFISQNRRGKPLTDYVTIISLISNTRTRKGLKIGSCLDKTVYGKGKKFQMRNSIV